MNNIIKAFEDATERKCFETYRRCLDSERLNQIEYDSFDRVFMNEPGETEIFAGARDISSNSQVWETIEPAVKLFLDGSRRTYKIMDISIGSQVFPVIAAQVGVGVCQRENRRMHKCELIMHSVIAIPDKIDSDGKNEKQHKVYCNTLLKKLNDAQSRISLDAVLLYPTMANENFEDKGIARIQDYMIEQEKAMVQNLVNENILSDRSWLIKDGSLEYSKINRDDDQFSFNRIRNNYRRVIGVSKSFNPELAKLKNNKSAAGLIASLKPFERTRALRYSMDRIVGKLSIWYLRLRKPRNGRGPFDGVVKIEKFLVTNEEQENGLKTSEIDNISAWIMNERNPVCYGKDERWANHLYPVFLTESFLKSKFMGTERFINLF